MTRVSLSDVQWCATICMITHETIIICTTVCAAIHTNMHDSYTTLSNDNMCKNRVIIGSYNGLAPCHYLNQCWLIVNWTPGNKFQWNLNLNSLIFIQENAFEITVCLNGRHFVREGWEVGGGGGGGGWGWGWGVGWGWGGGWGGVVGGVGVGVGWISKGYSNHIAIDLSLALKSIEMHLMKYCRIKKKYITFFFSVDK